MIRIAPLRRTTLQSLHIRLTLARTFTIPLLYILIISGYPRSLSGSRRRYPSHR